MGRVGGGHDRILCSPLIAGCPPFANAAMFSAVSRAHNYVVILTEVCIFLLSLVSLLRENHQCCVFSQEDTVQNLFPKDHSSDSFFKIASALFCFYPCYCCKNHLRAYERAALMAVYSLGKDFASLSSRHAQFEAAPPTQLSFPTCTAQRDTYHPSIKV